MIDTVALFAETIGGRARVIFRALGYLLRLALRLSMSAYGSFAPRVARPTPPDIAQLPKNRGYHSAINGLRFADLVSTRIAELAALPELGKN